MYVHPSIHLWRYSPFRALASLLRRLYASLFAALLLHPFMHSNCRASLRTTSVHLVLGLPTGYVCMYAYMYIRGIGFYRSFHLLFICPTDATPDLFLIYYFQVLLRMKVSCSILYPMQAVSFVRTRKFKPEIRIRS